MIAEVSMSNRTVCITQNIYEGSNLTPRTQFEKFCEKAIFYAFHPYILWDTVQHTAVVITFLTASKFDF